MRKAIRLSRFVESAQALARNFHRFWFAPGDGVALAYFRIATGLVMSVLYLALRPHWRGFFGPDGFKFEMSGRLNLFGWFPSLPIEYFWWIGFAAAVLMAIGFGTRMATLVLFLMQSSMIHTNRFVVNGEDLVFRFILFFSVFACLNSALSVDAWIRRRRGRPVKTGRMWPVRLIQINTIFVYAFSLPLKLAADHAWLSGDFMYYTLVNSTWSRFPFPDWTYHWFVVGPMTYTALIAEAAVVILIWWRVTRLPVLLTMIFFHLSIALILSNVTFFSIAMVCGLLSFVRHDDWGTLRSWGKASVGEAKA